MKVIRYVLRVVVWWVRSLWRKYPKPRREGGFSRSRLRKAWKPVLRGVDRRFNEGRDRRLLMERAVMVARRRRGWEPEEA